VLASTEPHLLGIPKKKQVESISGLILAVIVRIHPLNKPFLAPIYSN
jgi:hypothetical protein